MFICKRIEDLFHEFMCGNEVKREQAIRSAFAGSQREFLQFLCKGTRLYGADFIVGVYNVLFPRKERTTE